MSGLNSSYITTINLEPYFVSNQNGEANAGGIVTFYKDNNRTQLKSVFQLSQDPMTGAYSYVPLPNPITLSAVGTFQNSGGDNIAVYYYPFDEFGNQELYYITVYDAFGNLQFTREAWPFPANGGGTAGESEVGIANQLTNPQFAQVNFNAYTTMTVTIAGAGTTTVGIAPGWDLNIVATGASTVTVTQTPVVGQSALPFNPPFTLDLVIGSNITSCQLIQTLSHNPDWAAPQTTGVMGYLAGSILLGDGTSVNMQYLPSAGNAAQSILNTTNNTGAYAQVNGTIQLEAANNTDTGATGNDKIIVNILNLPGSASVSNVQVVPLTSNIANVQYDQTPVNRQYDYMFNYYNPELQYKPIPSYLIGWDFALNPRQPLGDTVAAFATGANTSNYVMDATIVFQSADNSFTTTTSVSGGLLLTATADTQLAIIQYIDGTNIRNMTLGDVCSMIEAYSDVVGGLTCTVSLWGTLDANVPDIKTPLFRSLVATLDANGKPATFNGTWVEIPRNFGAGTATTIQNATFTIQAANTQSSADPNNLYPFRGWSGEGTPTLQDDADFLAIVIGTATIPSGKVLHIQSATWQDGNIPTRPAPQAYTSAYVDCYRYYEKSFAQSVVPANNVGVNTGEFSNSQILGAGVSTRLSQIPFKVVKRGTPSITLYNPAANNSEVRNETLGADCSASSVTTSSPGAFAISCVTAGGSAVGETLGIHWVADARIGVL